VIETILLKLWQHFQLTILALFFSSSLSIPCGIWLAKTKRKWPLHLLRISLIIQTIPGLALMALAIVTLAALHTFIPLPVTGIFPAVIVLTLYALAPLLTGTYEAIRNVNAKTVEVALAMGMNSRQLLLWVELPLAMPHIMNGLRIASTWTIGMVTTTSLIGSGGLGDLILQGLRSMNITLILAGTIPAALLAILMDYLLSKPLKTN